MTLLSPGGTSGWSVFLSAGVALLQVSPLGVAALVADDGAQTRAIGQHDRHDTRPRRRSEHLRRDPSSGWPASAVRLVLVPVCEDRGVPSASAHLRVAVHGVFPLSIPDPLGLVRFSC